ncbi:phosphatidylserine decarboxylase 1 [Oleoguttula sp. CCFEE 5521]
MSLTHATRPAARRLLNQRCPHSRTQTPTHHFSTSPRSHRQNRKESFTSRLRTALGQTRTVWRPIPVVAGIAFLGAFQLYRTQTRGKATDDEWTYRDSEDGPSEDELGRPKKRKRIRPSGPWTVQIMSTLPLKALSRIWGKFNSIDLPYYMRVPGFKLYGWVFGVNFNEIEEPDLHNFRNLAEFFYRTLKPGVRPLDPNPNALLSPADGKVVQFGVIEGGDIEQVKGVTYSVDALLGEKHVDTAAPSSNIPSNPGSAQISKSRRREGDQEIISAEEEFAQVNGISYDLPSLFSGAAAKKRKPRSREGGKLAVEDVNELAEDQSTQSRATSEAEVTADLALSPRAQKSWWSSGNESEEPTALYYCVVYLAPGDYHRFHSPVSWVVESRRHFAGELYSVSPYLQRTLPGLFTLNERVVLLGRWKYGFFSYTPVGATNVGSIVVNFDRELRTNSLLTDTRADRAAEKAAESGEPYSGYAEATYTAASRVLGGHPLQRGEEMGGFQLGSTIVMVFEGPKGRRPTFDEGFMDQGRRGGWKWCIEKGMQVKVGEKLGYAVTEEA